MGLSLFAAPQATVSNSGSNPLIPTTISTGCQAYLEVLNADETLASCSSSLLGALDAFNPAASTSSAAASTSWAEVTSSLDTFCAQPRCSDVYVRATLSTFMDECYDELHAQEAVVLALYDVLYLVNPFAEAVCKKDSVDAYCLVDLASGTVPDAAGAHESLVSSASASSSAEADTNTTNLAVSFAADDSGSSGFSIASVASSALDPKNLFVNMAGAATRARARLARRQAYSSSSSSSSAAASTTEGSGSSSTSSGLDVTGVMPNVTTFTDASLPFLFLSSDMTSNMLCTVCTKSILATYIAWETRAPYALGLANSPVLSHQSELWQTLGSVCGDGFLTAITQEAGTLSVQSGSSRVAPVAALATALVALSAALFV